MGVIHIVIPLGTLSDKDIADAKHYLQENGIAFPPDAARGRHATQREIEGVLRSFESYECQFLPSSSSDSDEPWKQASLAKRAPPGSRYTYDEYADLAAVGPPADKDSPCDFYFSKGSVRLNYAILEKLARECGPLLCITEGEYDAVVFHREGPPSLANDHHLREGAD